MMVKVDKDDYGCKTNSMSSRGNLTKCSISQSIYHWYKECPHWVEFSDQNQVKFYLFSKEIYQLCMGNIKSYCFR